MSADITVHTLCFHYALIYPLKNCYKILILRYKSLRSVNWLLKSSSLTFIFLMWNRAGFLLFTVERAKKCLDFAATLYIIHLFICTVYGGWPSSTVWWVLNITGLAVMALLGEYLCMKREMREIPISRYRSSKPFYLMLISLSECSPLLDCRMVIVRTHVVYPGHSLLFLKKL